MKLRETTKHTIRNNIGYSLKFAFICSLKYNLTTSIDEFVWSSIWNPIKNTVYESFCFIITDTIRGSK